MSILTIDLKRVAKKLYKNKFLRNFELRSDCFICNYHDWVIVISNVEGVGYYQHFLPFAYIEYGLTRESGYNTLGDVKRIVHTHFYSCRTDNPDFVDRAVKSIIYPN